MKQSKRKRIETAAARLQERITLSNSFVKAAESDTNLSEEAKRDIVEYHKKSMVSIHRELTNINKKL